MISDYSVSCCGDDVTAGFLKAEYDTEALLFDGGVLLGFTENIRTSWCPVCGDLWKITQPTPTVEKSGLTINDAPR
jgi:hypothetical protein